MTNKIKAKQSSDTLLLLSGGLDSAWCLWKRCQDGLPTRVHHVVLTDAEGRQNEEVRATTDVLSYMNSNGWEHLITYSESKVDFGKVRVIPNFYLWAYWAGTIMRMEPQIENIVLPRHSDAFSDGPDGEGAQESDKAYSGIISIISGREPNLLLPMVHMTKAEVVADLPEKLRNRAWYCRRPKAGTPCRKCHTCKQVDVAMANMVQ